MQSPSEWASGISSPFPVILCSFYHPPFYLESWLHSQGGVTKSLKSFKNFCLSKGTSIKSLLWPYCLKRCTQHLLFSYPVLFYLTLITIEWYLCLLLNFVLHEREGYSLLLFTAKSSELWAWNMLNKYFWVNKWILQSVLSVRQKFDHLS